jgi:hypothetical protein
MIEFHELLCYSFSVVGSKMASPVSFFSKIATLLFLKEEKPPCNLHMKAPPFTLFLFQSIASPMKNVILKSQMKKITF